MTDAIDPIIEAAGLRSGTVLLLDARTPKEFNGGHALGAVHLDVKAWEALAKSERATFDNVQYWTGVIAALGIDKTRLVAVYDDGKMTDAARAWFILQHFGVLAFVVNGGWPAIRDAQGAATEGSAASADRVTSASTGTGIVRLFDRHHLREEIGSRTQIFDARTQAEFEGVDRRSNPRGGHVPGAVRIGHTDLLDSSGRLRTADELRALLAASGLSPGERVVTYCDGGGRAALAALAAVRAGYADVGVYYLSFADWARDDSCPIDS